MTSEVEQPTAMSEALGYEQARDELIEVVRRLEAGGTTLEESLALWERGSDARSFGLNPRSEIA